MSYKFTEGMAVKHMIHGTGEIVHLSTKDLGDGTPPAATVEFGDVEETVPLESLTVDWKYYRDEESVYRRDMDNHEIIQRIIVSLKDELMDMGNVQEVIQTKHDRLLVRTNIDGLGFGNLHDRYNIRVTETWIIDGKSEQAIAIEVKR